MCRERVVFEVQCGNVAVPLQAIDMVDTVVILYIYFGNRTSHNVGIYRTGIIIFTVM